jgi:hypothetical protein
MDKKYLKYKNKYFELKNNKKGGDKEDIKKLTDMKNYYIRIINYLNNLKNLSLDAREKEFTQANINYYLDKFMVLNINSENIKNLSNEIYKIKEEYTDFLNVVVGDELAKLHTDESIKTGEINKQINYYNQKILEIMDLLSNFQDFYLTLKEQYERNTTDINIKNAYEKIVKIRKGI